MPNTNDIAVVTGASGGIGEAVVNKIRERFKICYNLDLAPPQSNNSKFIQTDIANLDDVSNAVEKFTQSGGKLKALILCAGIGVHEKLTEGDPVKWKRVIDTNLLGSLNVIRAFIPFMDEGGDVVFISSVSAGQAYPYGGVYAATKTALNVIAETLRLETDENLKVSIIEPGLVKSGFMKNTISGSRENEELPFKAMNADAVADAVGYLLEQPSEISVNKLIIRPSDQTF